VSSTPDERAVADDDAEFRKADPPAKPRLYIVHLVPTALNKADDVDKSKAAELHHSILSSVVGSEEEATRCMVRSFAYLHAFSAMLTDSQARTISDLPGVLGACPNTEHSIDDPTWKMKLILLNKMKMIILNILRWMMKMILLKTASMILQWKWKMEDEDEEIVDHETISACQSWSVKCKLVEKMRY
jgi:hypothetical protein